VQSGVTPGRKDLVLALRPGGKARVQVVGPDGNPVEGAIVYLSKLNGARVLGANGTTDTQGLTEVDLPPGTAELGAGKSTGHNRLTGDVNLTVAAGATVPVQITVAEPRSRPRP
jgi:hypothetical protein